MYKLNKIYFLKLLGGIVFAFCIGGFALGWVNPSEPYYEYLFLAGYGGIPLPLDGGEYIRLLLVSLVPQIFLIFILANYMLDDFNICSVYIFTRTNQKKTWFARKCISLFFLVALYYALQFAMLFLLGRAMGGLTVFDPTTLLYIVINELLLLVLLGFIYVLAVNLLSLKVGINYAFLSIVLLATLSSAFVLTLKSSVTLKFIPLSQVMFIWHDSEKLVLYRDFIGDYLPHFTIFFSLLYLLVIILALFMFGMYLIDNLEIIGHEREG